MRTNIVLGTQVLPLVWGQLFDYHYAYIFILSKRNTRQTQKGFSLGDDKEKPIGIVGYGALRTRRKGVATQQTLETFKGFGEVVFVDNFFFIDVGSCLRIFFADNNFDMIFTTIFRAALSCFGVFTYLCHSTK